PERALTRSGEPVKRKKSMIPEPKDKLDAATTVVVSGPEDVPLDWHAVDWRACEENVRRLRQRIFTASQAGDLPRVRRLQKLMLRSRSNTLVSVRRVTERNAGRLTAGVDGEVVLTPEAKLELADRVQHNVELFKAQPVRRLDADLAAAFDLIDHSHIVNQLGSFPARGVVSPVLLNVALHGMEQAAGVRYHMTGTHAGQTVAGCPVLIRYADDLLAWCHSKDEAFEVKARLAAWLTPRGLAFNEDKTRVVTLDEGFDFLGFNVRRYHGKLLIKPSKAAVRRIRKRLATELRSLRGANAQAVIKRLNPIIRGWAAYYRTQVTSETFGKLDHYLWKLTYKWATFSHENKSASWVFARYFAKFIQSRQDRWVFGDRNSGAYMHRFAWTHIVRHEIVKSGASPDDPALGDYWARRQSKTPLPINNT